MDTTQMLDQLRDPGVLKTIQTALPVCLAFLSGIAGCLHSWVIPLLRRTTSPRDLTSQFSLIVHLGNSYLLTSGRVMGATLIATALLLRGHPDANVARLWRYYAAAAGVLLPVAPWEAYLIFPTNERILAVGEEMGREESKGSEVENGEGGKEGRERRRREEIGELMESWRRWHTGRIVMPLSAAVVTAVALLKS